MFGDIPKIFSLEQDKQTNRLFKYLDIPEGYTKEGILNIDRFNTNRYYKNYNISISSSNINKNPKKNSFGILEYLNKTPNESKEQQNITITNNSDNENFTFYIMETNFNHPLMGTAFRYSKVFELKPGKSIDLELRYLDRNYKLVVLRKAV